VIWLPNNVWWKPGEVTLYVVSPSWYSFTKGISLRFWFRVCVICACTQCVIIVMNLCLRYSHSFPVENAEREATLYIKPEQSQGHLSVSQSVYRVLASRSADTYNNPVVLDVARTRTLRSFLSKIIRKNNFKHFNEYSSDSLFSTFVFSLVKLRVVISRKNLWLVIFFNRFHWYRCKLKIMQLCDLTYHSAKFRKYAFRLPGSC
jgi:hypothetical protein